MDIHITRNGEQHGPYPEASAREMLAAGQLQPADLAWHAGADGWKPLSEVLGVGAQPAATPPPPPKPPGSGIPKRTMAGAALAEEKPAEEKSEDSEAEDPDKIRVTRKGEPIGPYSREKAEKYFADGQLLPTDWGWHDGMDEWKPLYEVLDMEVPASAGVAVSNTGNTGYSGTGGAWTIGNCLTEGMESFKGNLGGAVVLTLVFMIVIGITGMLPLINLFLQGPIAAGMLYFFIKQVRREPTAIGDMFAGFKRGYAQLLLLSILSILILIVAALPGISVMIFSEPAFVAEVMDVIQDIIAQKITTQAEAKAAVEGIITAFKAAGAGILAGGVLAFLVPPIVLSFTLFSTPLVIDRQMKAFDALKASARLMKGQWFKVVLFFILVGIISQVGIIALGIGLLFTFPIAMSAVASCYLKNAGAITAAHTAPISKGMKIGLACACILPVGGAVAAIVMAGGSVVGVVNEAKGVGDNNGTDTAKAPAKAPEMDIFTAIKPENIEALKQHIAAGTDLETKEPNGSTPLLVAARLGHEEGVKLLLEGGANIKAVNKQGNTALHIAAFFAYPKVVNLLLVKGADAGAKSNDGKLAFQSVSIPWNSQVAGSYKFVYGLLQMPLDAAEVQRLQIARPQCAQLLLAPTQKAMQQPQPNQ